MIKWWHQNNWGKAACGRRTRALKCWRSCACKHSKFLVLEICLIVCNLSSNNFCALWQKRLFWSASIYCCSFLAEIEQLCYVNIQFEHSVQTRNSSIPTSSVNIQLKHSMRISNSNIHCKHSMFTRFSDLVPKLRREDEAKCEGALIDMDSEVRMLR